MSLWNRNKVTFNTNTKNSLQEQLHFFKTLKDSLITPHIHNPFKEASRFACLPGSLTAEAALVFPLFMFAMINLCTLFLMFQSYGQHLAQIHQTGRQMAVWAYVQGTDVEKQEVELMEIEYVKPLVNLMGYRGCLLVNGCVIHKWIGYDLKGTTDTGTTKEQMVYVTKYGSVYHTLRSCSYLNPKVETVLKAVVTEKRNADGSRYTPCQTCEGNGQVVYITNDGEHYHSTVTCGGLKRTVDCISQKTALEQGRRSCSKCGHLQEEQR